MPDQYVTVFVTRQGRATSATSPLTAPDSLDLPGSINGQPLPVRFYPGPEDEGTGDERAGYPDEYADMVETFHRHLGIPVRGTATADIPEAGDRIRYMREERKELEDAIRDGDIVGIADALGDLAYLVHGSALAHGIVLRPVVAAIHASNMTKSPPDHTGKAVKGPGYRPPDITGALAAGAAQ